MTKTKRWGERGDAEYEYYYAEYLGFKKVPAKTLKAISNHWIWSFYFLQELHKRGLPIRKHIKMIEKIANSSIIHSEWLINYLNYKNIPQVLIDKVSKSPLMGKPEIQRCVIEHNRKKKLEKLLT